MLQVTMGISDRIAVMYCGQIVEWAPEDIQALLRTLTGQELYVVNIQTGSLRWQLPIDTSSDLLGDVSGVYWGRLVSTASPNILH